MIDVRTAEADGHWDYADIQRLIEYRDQLEAALREIFEGAKISAIATYRAIDKARGLLTASETPTRDPLLGDRDVFGVRGLTSENQGNSNG